ncbi:MAG: penicillin acylase family protein [Spirochaetes bacterium]|nr:MAG: penicillin acylase family protein [Spirochaetota bacterium]
MKLKDNELVLTGPNGSVRIRRNKHGVPEVTAGTIEDCVYGQGWVHAHDRQLQTLLTRVLLQGRAAECLAGDPELVEIDRYMRRMNFLPDPDEQVKRLEPHVRAQLEAYRDGYNRCLSDNGPVWEFKLMGYAPGPWEIKDSLILGKIMGYLGLGDAQVAMERLIVQMIRNDIPRKKLGELFPYLTDKIDADLLKKVHLEPPLVPAAAHWLAKLPKMMASNNWVVSGKLTESKKPILCNDPHLEVNRLPNIWQEIVMRLPDNVLAGASLPGVPGVAIGRSNVLSWGATYSFMDSVDFRVEQCREGKYLRGAQWKPFKVREEIIKVKKGEPVVEKVYENDLGLLEGDPFRDGHCLVLCWSAARGCGAGEFNGFLNLPFAKNVREGMECFRRLEALSFNWVLADTQGNIGYQMSGRTFRRPKGVSGLIPHPAWDKKFNSKGFIPAAKLPASYNPREGYIVTANQDLNHLGKDKPINLPMAPYRSMRIAQLLRKKRVINADYMKKMHFDLYSLQAQELMKVLRPLLPDSANGAALRDWECVYTPDSHGAMLFESVYLALLRVVFGDHGMGREVVDYLVKETGIFNDYYGNFDTILMNPRSSWYADSSRDELFRIAIAEGLAVKAVPWGQTRRLTFSHLLFGGKLPLFLGFDRGPISLPGNRATIPQGQIFKSAGRLTSFSPSFRMIADMATAALQTNMAGGSSDRRYSKWYANDLENWLHGVYKTLS